MTVAAFFHPTISPPVLLPYRTHWTASCLCAHPDGRSGSGCTYSSECCRERCCGFLLTGLRIDETVCRILVAEIRDQFRDAHAGEIAETAGAMLQRMWKQPVLGDPSLSPVRLHPA